ncbi:serine/threonine-protein kinase [Sandaracinus amylolyticus]|uniref:serine/threonine-protein kinase n=1 Tax=Sandaracinus amylolyticus TaxID=927083 RepID=UPI001F2F4D70|nr:serine/threonine-protein kinase [Sandaracinus amylolyticus]UJR86223.1 Hypothetical protein I5071_83050 [Sandaracinus amylolyticus]
MSTGASAPAIGSWIAGRYRIDAPLGSGTMGAVYRGTRADGVPVAIKLMHPESVERPESRRRFEREAAALAAVTHPNVIGVLELADFSGAPCLVMELLEGYTLEALLARNRLAPEHAIAIADQMLAGLAFAHAHGILHRDIKPENVFLARQPDGSTLAKLLDFGLAKFTESAMWGSGSVLTQHGAILGTPAYMAPEQVFGPTVDARTDVYGAGVVLFELLTGSWPFVAEEITDMFRAHAIDPVPALRAMRPELDARPELEAVVKRAMAKRREDRFTDAREMRVALSRVPRPIARIVAG